jgi:hypothetical protein
MSWSRRFKPLGSAPAMSPDVRALRTPLRIRLPRPNARKKKNPARCPGRGCCLGFSEIEAADDTLPDIAIRRRRGLPTGKPQRHVFTLRTIRLPCLWVTTFLNEQWRPRST